MDGVNGGNELQPNSAVTGTAAPEVPAATPAQTPDQAAVAPKPGRLRSTIEKLFLFGRDPDANPNPSPAPKTTAPPAPKTVHMFSEWQHIPSATQTPPPTPETNPSPILSETPSPTATPAPEAQSPAPTPDLSVPPGFPEGSEIQSDPMDRPVIKLPLDAIPPAPTETPAAPEPSATPDAPVQPEPSADNAQTSQTPRFETVPVAETPTDTSTEATTETPPPAEPTTEVTPAPTATPAPEMTGTTPLTPAETPAQSDATNTEDTSVPKVIPINYA